jgi:two-component system, sensor histidine kinase RegB
LLWLVRLRWHALAAVALAIALAPVTMGVSIAWLPAAGVVAGIGLSNLAALLWLRLGRPVRSAALGVVLIGDTLWLTAALALSGGSLNPFVSLYVIHVTLAALLLEPGWVVAVGLASAAGYALLPERPHPALAPGTGSSLGALVITLGINGTLVVRMVAAYRRRQEALARAEREAARAEKLTSLATLAAGAAHELATPLGTIAVASTELEALIDEAPEQARQEARIIREQVARCKRILQRLGTRAGSEPGELAQRTTSGELLELVRRELGAQSTRLETSGDAMLVVEAPIESLASVLASLVNNALAASPGDSPVSLVARPSGEAIRFTTSDRGSGIDAALLARLGEPFLTTKAPGEGMGLGLFLAIRFARSQGGQLHVESLAGSGTRVHLDLPRPPEAVP